MYSRRFLLVLTLVALVSATAFSAVGSPESPGDGSLGPTEGQKEAQGVQADCAPPCGYIWPRIGVDTDISNPYALSKIDDFPRESEVTITYSWDMEQEGTGIPEPGEEMTILIVVTRTPAFLTAQLDRNACEFQIIPVVSEYEVCKLTLTVDLDKEALPSSEEQLREEGHRLMLFAASEESGTFMRSYGLEDIRFKFDDAPSEAGVDGERDVAEAPLPVVGLLALTLVVVALAADRIRRR